MGLQDSIIINVFSFILCFAILFYYEKNGDKGEKHTSLYVLMLWLVLILFLVDAMGRFDGNPNSIFPIVNHMGNFLLFLLAPVLPSLWILYLHYYITPDRKPKTSVVLAVGIINLLNVILLIGTQWTGWYYSIDSENIYSRGALYFIVPLMTVILLLHSVGYILRFRKKIERTHLWPFLMFPLAPLLGTVLQTVIYGIPFVLMGLVLSVLMIALFGQSIETNVDYLSGAYNRKRLEYYLRKKIAASTKNNTFSAIMADVNNLKNINDTLGHTVGDEVLVTISSLIRSILRSNDFVARYGGDEFCIIIDTSSEEILEIIVGKINRQLAHYNEMSLKPFKLGLSMGYAVYDPESGMTAKEFYNLIDSMMYEDKKKTSHLM